EHPVCGRWRGARRGYRVGSVCAARAEQEERRGGRAPDGERARHRAGVDAAMMRALVLVTFAACSIALAACSIAPIDYTGKQCPCPDGYRCELLTQTCTRDETLADAHDDATDSRIDAMTPGTSCLQNPKSNLVYSSVGFSDFPAGWLNGSGAWTKAGNEVSQTNANNTLAWISHAVMANGGNYRVVATMRFI